MVSNEFKPGVFYSEIFEETTKIMKITKYYYETYLLGGSPLPLSSNARMQHRFYFKSAQEAVHNKQDSIAGMTKMGDVVFKKGIFEKDVVYLDYKGNPANANEEWANRLNDFFYNKG